MNYSELLQLAKGWGNFISGRIIIWRLQKSHPPTLEKSDPQCGFSEYIERTIEAHKQKYRLFACFFSWKKKVLNFSSQNATAPPVLSGLRAKRGKEAEIPINSLPFKAGKGVSNDEAI